MQIMVYRATEIQAVPKRVFATFDDLDDRFLAAFENYSGEKLIVVAQGTTGSVRNEPIAVLVAAREHIIVAHIDTHFDAQEDDVGDEFAPIKHDEPNATKRLAALLARLRAVSPTSWLLVHDADDAACWLAQGFVAVEPPPNVSADDALLVLAWGALPEDAHTLLRARGLFWQRDLHRG